MDPDIRRLLFEFGGAVIAIRAGCVSAGHAAVDGTHQRWRDLATERGGTIENEATCARARSA